MFKKIFSVIILAAILAAPVNAAPIGQYTRVGYIEDVDRTGNFTVLVTKDGHVWFWESATFQTKHGRKYLKPGSRVVIVLNGRGTPDVTDDQLVDFDIYER